MPSTLNDVKSQVTSIHKEVKKFNAEIDKDIAAVSENKDLTDLARHQRTEKLKRRKADFYSKKMKEKASTLQNADDKLRRSVYSGKNTSDLAFDEAARKFSQAKKDKELLDVISQKPSDETLRAVAKSAVTGKSINWKVLSAAANVDDSIGRRVNELKSFHEEFGGLMPKGQSLKQKLFGDHSSVDA